MQKEEKEFLILLAKMFADSILKPKVIKGKETIISNTPNSTITLAGKDKTKYP